VTGDSGIKESDRLAAIAFDVQGTCVDFYQPILRIGAAVNRNKRLSTDWAAVVAAVKHANLPFDAILTAELVETYKPAPAVYQLAVDFLGYRPDQILMVACHKYDLRAAKAFGMRTRRLMTHSRGVIVPSSNRGNRSRLTSTSRKALQDCGRRSTSSWQTLFKRLAHWRSTRPPW